MIVRLHASSTDPSGQEDLRRIVQATLGYELRRSHRC